MNWTCVHFARHFFLTSPFACVLLGFKVRIPRTYKRFAGLMVQLLHKLKIRSSSNSEVLLKVIKNPLSQHIPAGVRAFGIEVGGDLYSPTALASMLSSLSSESAADSSSKSSSRSASGGGGGGDPPPPVMLVFGAMAAGNVELADHPYMEKLVCISEYPLSGACSINRVCGAIESELGIV
jgi:rRNA small subunit pseudouridine methyltransferase Nep1